MSNYRPKISIIMGVYNCEDTLSESIESILNQTYENWEFIICDDCSTDLTYKIASDYAKVYPKKIKVIKNIQNHGLAYSLNHCLKYVTGKYVARQDGDDISIKQRLEKQVEFLEKNEDFDLVGSNMISFNENGIIGERGVLIAEPDKYIFKTSTPFCHATIMTKTDVYRSLEGYKVSKYTRRCEDLDLWYRFFEKGYRGYNLQQGLYMVRDDINSYRRRDLKNYLYSIKVSYEGYKKINMPNRYYIYLFKPILSYIIPNFILRIYHKNKIKRNKKK